MREYAETIRKTVNPAVSIDYGAIPYAERQVMHLCADISELTQDTGWLPQTNFKKRIDAILDDYSNIKYLTNII